MGCKRGTCLIVRGADPSRGRAWGVGSGTHTHAHTPGRTRLGMHTHTHTHRRIWMLNYYLSLCPFIPPLLPILQSIEENYLNNICKLLWGLYGSKYGKPCNTLWKQYPITPKTQTNKTHFQNGSITIQFYHNSVQFE